MATINQLPLLDQASSGDQVAVYSSANGDARRMPVSALLEYFQENMASLSPIATVYAPLTGFNIAVLAPTSAMQWVVLQPAGTLAAGTITLPLSTQTIDGTELLVTTTTQITSFTLALNGASFAYGAPTTLAANGFFKMRFLKSMNNWYRIS